MPLLSDTLVKLKIVDEISEETVRKTLKQTSSNLGVAPRQGRLADQTLRFCI